MAWLNDKGLSLLGTLLAVFMLATVAVAVSQLVARTERASGGSRESLVATLLAREGLELVRALRDTNWFLQRSDHRPWTQGLCDLSPFTIDARRVRRLDGVGQSSNDRLFITNKGEWVHDGTQRATPFKRLVSVDCSDQDVSLLVTATVTWQAGSSRERTWTVSERLYDWVP